MYKIKNLFLMSGRPLQSTVMVTEHTRRRINGNEEKTRMWTTEKCIKLFIYGYDNPFSNDAVPSLSFKVISKYEDDHNSAHGNRISFKPPALAAGNNSNNSTSLPLKPYSKAAPPPLGCHFKPSEHAHSNF